MAELHQVGERNQQELAQAIDHIKHLETNDNETRTQVLQMTDQIDQRDYKIEKLEQKIMEHQKRARIAFK